MKQFKKHFMVFRFFIIRLWSVWIKTDFTVCRSFFLLELNFFPRLIRGNPLVGQNKQTSWLYSWLVWFCRWLYPNNLSKKTIKIFWISEFNRARLSNHNLIAINTVLNNVFSKYASLNISQSVSWENLWFVITILLADCPLKYLGIHSREVWRTFMVLFIDITSK